VSKQQDAAHHIFSRCVSRSSEKPVSLQYKMCGAHGNRSRTGCVKFKVAYILYLGDSVRARKPPTSARRSSGCRGPAEAMESLGPVQAVVCDLTHAFDTLAKGGIMFVK